ncbi:fatty acid desaturase [Lentisphaerota bacterium ZTH]|nr:fatty acid desaturase [Lentisphaerota bacterium]WET07479.1 fatty acid desaturase [Lentisphaerota bacterium ZTH]
MYNQPGKKHPNNSEPKWYKDTSKFEEPDLKTSLLQIITSVGCYAGAWAILVWMINIDCSLWLILLAAAIASVFQVRIFIIFHDCTHNSFFISRKANKICGYFAGLFTFTPYDRWQYTHNIHHNTYADLDRRGVGDVWTLTVKEYLNSPLRTKIAYRLYRNPLIMFGFGPAYLFIFDHRFSFKNTGAKGRFSVMFNNLALLLFISILGILGVSPIYFLLYMYILVVAGIIGVWLFFIQHQFDGVYWAHHNEWDPVKAAFEGSSYYKLPKFFQWLSGNIGLHPIHHLRPRIPNYNLQRCYNETTALHAIKVLTVKRSIKSLWLNLWDEKEKKLVSFHSLKKN